MQPLKKFVAFRLSFLIALEAALAALCNIAALWLYNPHDLSLYMEFEGGWLRILAVALTYIVASYVFDFFRQVQATSRVALTLQLLQLIGLILLIQAVLGFLNPGLNLPQQVALLGSLLLAMAIIPWRLFIRPVLWNAFGAQKVLLVGSGPGLDRLAFAFENQAILGSEVIGVIPDVSESANGQNSADLLGRFQETMAQRRPDQIIVSGYIWNKEFLRTLMCVKASGTTVRTVGQAWELLFGRIYSYDLDPYAVIYRNELDSRPANLALQSIYNNLLGLAAVIVSLPLMLLIALLLKLTRSGPVFSQTQCVGLHGIPFHMYRFRRSSPKEDVMTHLLTRFKLEGLPQVLNLVRGELALIGPRAERIEFHDALAEMLPFYGQRHHVKPGIFGWSQLHCDLQDEEDTLARVEYDLYYIKHVSFLIDLHVVVRALRWLLSEPQEESSR